MSCTTPNAARAFSNPAAPAANSASAIGAVSITAPAAVSHTNEPRVHATLRHVGRPRNRVPAARLAPPRCTIAAMAMAGGMAAKNRNERCENASPNSRTTHGTSRTMLNA